MLHKRVFKAVQLDPISLVKGRKQVRQLKKAFPALLLDEGANDLASLVVIDLTLLPPELHGLQFGLSLLLVSFLGLLLLFLSLLELLPHLVMPFMCLLISVLFLVLPHFLIIKPVLHLVYSYEKKASHEFWH